MCAKRQTPIRNVSHRGSACSGGYYSPEPKTIVDHSKFDAPRCGRRAGASNAGGAINKTDDTVIFCYGKDYGKFGLKTTLPMAKKGINIRMYLGYSSNVYTLIHPHLTTRLQNCRIELVAQQVTGILVTVHDECTTRKYFVR